MKPDEIKCQYCGSEEEHRYSDGLTHFKCQTWAVSSADKRAPLCIEREARQKAEAERDEYRDIAREYACFIDNGSPVYDHEIRHKRLKKRLEKLEAQQGSPTEEDILNHEWAGSHGDSLI